MAGLRPTLRTVADAAGVSPMTVSNAYNRPDQLSVGTRDRVLLVAAQLGYAGPSPAGRSLRRGRSDTVGVLLTERLPDAFADPGLLELLHGLASGLAEAGQALLLVPTDLPPRPGDGASPLASALPRPTGAAVAEPAVPARAAVPVVRTGIVQSAIVDALVLCSLSPDDPAVTAAIARRIPNHERGWTANRSTSSTTPTSCPRSLTTGACWIPCSSISNRTSPPIRSGGTVYAGIVITASTGVSGDTRAATTRRRRSLSVTMPSCPSRSTTAALAPASVIRRATSAIAVPGSHTTVGVRISVATG